MIRPAVFNDPTAIARVHVQSWEETYRGILPDSTLDMRPLAVRIEHWKDWLTFYEASAPCTDSLTSRYYADFDVRTTRH